MNTSGNTILITGGGSGIGRELAREFQALGNTVIIAGRTLKNLEETIDGRAGMHARALDVDNADAIKRFVADLIRDFPALNGLINNAGIMTRENLLADPVDLAVAEAIVATNILGPIRLTSALLPHLRAQPAATVMTVTSGLAFVPLSATPTYSASKAAMHSWTQSLRYLLRDTNIEVIEIAPPGVQTELTPGQSTRDAYMPLKDYIAETMANFKALPATGENLTDRVKFLRNAEAEGRFEATFRMVNEAYRS